MKKLLSLIIATVMCLSMMSTAFAAEMNFTDVQTSDWFYNDVKSAVEMGLVNGKSATTYVPNDNLTYAEAIKLAACMNMLYNDGAVSALAGDPWYKPYVDYCVENKIIDKEYNYTDNATRAGYMGIFANALPDDGLEAINNVPDDSIPDVPSSRGYAPAVYKLYRAGILTGVDAAHNCNPLANIKRSEVATILVRMMVESKRVSITDMGNAEEQKPEEKEPEVKEPETTEPEVKALAIKTQPESVSVVADTEVTFAVEADGGKAPYTYKWQTNRDGGDFYDINKGTFNFHEGFDTATYKVKISQTVIDNKQGFRCIITDADGTTITSEGATVSENSSHLGTRPSVSRPSTVTRPTITRALAIADQSKDMSGSIGLFKLDVTVEGGKAPYTCQWQKLTTIINGTKGTQGYVNLTDTEGTVKGATTANLIVSLTTLGTYKYKCVVTDADGNSVTSEVITLTVNSESAGGRVSIPSSGKSGY